MFNSENLKAGAGVAGIGLAGYVVIRTGEFLGKKLYKKAKDIYESKKAEKEEVKPEEK